MKLLRIKRKELYGILYMVIAYLLAVLVVLNYFAFTYADLISEFFHQSNYMVVDDGNTDISSTDYQLDYASTSDLMVAEREYAERVQSEGVILLQNNNLPMAPTKTTFLGLYSRDDMLSAGASVSDNAPAMQTQFENTGFAVNQTMIDYYNSISEEAAPDEFTAAAAASIADYSDLAVVVLFSGGAESRDITVDDLRFTDTEKELIQYASENFTEVVVLLNTSNTIECGYLEGFDNLSVLYINFSGDAGIGIIPQIITGEINPSGKTADTFAYDVESPISMLNYENSAEDQAILSGGEAVGNYVNYIEGIYVGYRYFETRYEDVVLGTENVGDYDYASLVQYPFGYGLSYTQFAYSDFNMTENEESFDLSVTVTNTGDIYSGKEAVGFYMQSPYTDYDKENSVEKSAVQLVEFAKTGELAPGASEMLTVTVDKEEMRAYDANNARTYIVDDGTYYFAVGANAHDAINNILAAKGEDGIAIDTDKMTAAGDASLVGRYTQAAFDAETYSYGADGNKITNEFDDVNLNYYYDGEITYVSRNDWAGTIPAQKAGTIDATDAMLANMNPTFAETGVAAPTMDADNGLSLVSLKGLDYDNEYWDQLLDQLSADDLMSITAYGGFKTTMLSSINKPASVDKDGPAGIDSSQLGGETCYTFPSESMLACTWNKDLVAELGYFISQDCLLTGTTGWYAPACNIHRIAICGRTREYFSEDAYLSGTMAYQVASSAQAHGAVTYTKHFALNEQENNRSEVCTFSNEQAIREIYLKPFEMATEDGGSMGIMTSMNRVGTIYASSEYNLCTEVLRNEWGFKGVVITDFVSGPSNKVVPRELILAGTDLFLCTLSDTSMFVENYANDADLLNALRDSAHRICYTYVNSNLMNGLSSSYQVVSITPTWQYAMYVVDAVIVYLLYLMAMSPILNKEDKEQGEREVQA